MIVIGLFIFGITMFVLGYWCGIGYLTGKEHAQTEKWNNDKNIYFGDKLKFNDKDYAVIPIKSRY